MSIDADSLTGADTLPMTTTTKEQEQQVADVDKSLDTLSSMAKQILEHIDNDRIRAAAVVLKQLEDQVDQLTNHCAGTLPPAIKELLCNSLYNNQRVGQLKSEAQEIDNLLNVMLHPDFKSKVDKYASWIPRCQQSQQLAANNKNRAVYCQVSCPWPVADRDIVLYGYGVDMLEDEDKVVVVARTYKNDFPGLEVPGTPKGMANTNQAACSTRKTYTDEERAALPLNFDARSQWPGCISIVRDQGSCSSCWAQTSTSILADRLCIASNERIKVLLSPQSMVDCSRDCRPNEPAACQQGCVGGYMDVSLEYLVEKGVPADSCLPYLSQQSGMCPTQCQTGGQISLYTATSCTSFASLKDAQVDIMKYGSILATFDIYSDLKDYKEGVYVKSASAIYQEGHAARVIGWGVDNGVEYWLCANSWGQGWGNLGGFFKIRRNSNEANFENSMMTIYPNVEGAPPPPVVVPPVESSSSTPVNSGNEWLPSGSIEQPGYQAGSVTRPSFILSSILVVGSFIIAIMLN
eukprot:gene7432-8695_t